MSILSFACPIIRPESCGTPPNPSRSRSCVRGVVQLLVVICCASAALAHAQGHYPSRPIRVIAPFAPGGGSDTLARLLGPRLSEALGQTLVVDNRPGGGGTVGAAMAVRAAPDGYTLAVVSGSYGTNAALHELAFDPVKDITPIILIGETGMLVTVNPKTPIFTVKELIAFARANPHKMSFGSAGIGGIGHLTFELFRMQTKVDIVHVPFKGTGPVLAALLANHVQMSFSSMVPAIPHIKAGRLRPLAITLARGSRALPDVPPVAETVPGFDVVHWYGLWGPKGLPRPIVDRLNREVAKVMDAESMRKWFANEGMDPAGGPPEQFRNRIAADVEKWKSVVKIADIKLAN